MSDFKSDTLVKKSGSQVSTVVEGETVVLETGTGTYFSLDEVGALVWSALNEPCSVSDICQRIVAEYDVENEECRADVIKLLTQLRDAKLVEVV